MGLLGRIYRLVSAYVTATSDRLERAEEEVRRESARAKGEVDDILSRPAPFTAPPSSGVRATEPVSAYAVLGLTSEADLATVQQRWRELAARADPKRFPAGSEEEKKAAAILRRINNAYRELRNYLDPTGGRFEKLEI